MLMAEKCDLCDGINGPHPMDSYHQFLQALKFADENLKQAKKIADKGLPSIQIQLRHTLDSISNLIIEAKII